MSVETYITTHKLNVIYGDHSQETVLPIEKITIGENGEKEAYQVTYSPQGESATPVSQMVFYKTWRGVRGIGFRSFSNDVVRAKDFNIWQEILRTYQILEKP